MQSTNSTGLRERKREETRTQLEEAAVELVLRDGLEKATVDAISERAFVSTRTFFNYFDCKEDAILGIDPPKEADPEPLNIGPDTDIIGATMHLLLGTMGSHMRNPSLHVSRKKIISQYPELLHRQLGQMFKVTHALTETVAEMLRTHQTSPIAPVNAHAEVILMLCAGAARAATREWALAGATAPVEDIERRAVRLVGEVQEILS